MQPQGAKRKGTPFYEDKTAMFVVPILGALAVGWGIYTAGASGTRADEAEAQVQTLTAEVRDARNEARGATDRSEDLSAQLATLRRAHAKELAAQQERLQKGFDERLARERASWERQLEEAKAAVPVLPQPTVINDGPAVEDEGEPTVAAVPNEGDGKWAFQNRCLKAIAVDLGVNAVNQTPGGMISARPWGPPGAGLWFWKPMIRVTNTEHVEQYTCTLSNDRGFEVFPGL
ncbi:hypothetical protein DAETH_25620 [Deinococcus aetherius]|uniref:Uncharacterized protein n=1 Tax=Deinococcus aetherius TaxID=200252 RepID=A0ABN6RKQ2_9DEIO|nr:hypothetical protein [Deinococcus aetherius]BDP42593.1 hypothetical protein DAETH_25620 [Deinococcus aetherius]